eukprot:GEMP01006702.1.p1 GENE.GEMP01006702.1~~GEMP01006702.1.p1  ORF type:complete len:689 (+),score=196.59 GEMP01006702.1:78-2144(+)
MAYLLFSSAFHKSFGNLPDKDMQKLRKDTVKYISEFNPQAWYDDPMRTIINGKPVPHADDKTVTTPNAFDEPNGKQILSPPAVIDQVIAHVKNFVPTKLDNRKGMRAIEDMFLSGDKDAMIAGNQSIDFRKQDGVTEIEESCGACVVEMRLNDALFADEQAGKVIICRRPAFVGCVSNFSTFLDLCRKTIRNVELGIPVVVLSRSNTGQHMYRWFQFLVENMKKHDVNLGMVTFVSCSLEEQIRLVRQYPDSPFYVTSNRKTASNIKQIPCNNLFASTGGPNTLVATEFTPQVAEAVRISNLIENKGQCTALRHFVCPTKDPKMVDQIYDKVTMVSSPSEALEKGEFCALFKRDAKRFKVEKGYKTLDEKGNGLIHYRINDQLPVTIDEMWRQAYIDITNPSDIKSEEFIQELSKWLNHHQPISLAINGDDKLARRLFEVSSMVVYTVGSTSEPALTCQARPQECETFGEFPPRRELNDYTTFPVIIPSSTPGYNSSYSKAHLEASGKSVKLPEKYNFAEKLIHKAGTPAQKGYLKLMVEYVLDACGPRVGHSLRTTLYGIQRPPLVKVGTVLRVNPGATYDDVLLYALPFLVTNAKQALVISRHADAIDCSVFEGVPVITEATNSLEKEAWNSIALPGRYNIKSQLPLVSHFASLLFPMGHIKSVKRDDKEFLKYFSASPKWLRPLH